MYPANLEQCADYIRENIEQPGIRVSQDWFTVRSNRYCNVVASTGPDTPKRIVVGAHYDTCYDTPGADDNASGVAVLIEIARLLGESPPASRVDLVAFALEEPPFWRTRHMGSARHARQLKAEGVSLRCMICLEMVGFFSDHPGSQRFPLRILRLFYPDVGNFIGVVGSLSQLSLVRNVKSHMRAATDLPVHSINAPSLVPGIDMSDHFNYWRNGFPAVMVTDTSFYRNPDYHGPGDTADKLDYQRMAKVAEAVFHAVSRLAE